MVTLNVWLSLTYSATYSYQETLLLYTQRCGGTGAVHGYAIDSVLWLPINRRGASASPVTHARCSHLMEFAASPAGSGLCPPNCNHGPMLSCMSCPHRRWESETGRLVLTGEITISKPINIFTISLREEKQENELTFFFFCLKGLRINYREEEALSSNTPLQIPLIKGGKFISSKNSWFRLTLAFPKLRL